MPTQTLLLPKTDLSLFNFDGETKGCGFFNVYKATKDKTKVLRIQVDERKLNVIAKKFFKKMATYRICMSPFSMP